jgi:DNA-binding HxlR family transcriptional regulator
MSDGLVNGCDDGSEEGIASNVLADRLQRLVEVRMITRAPDPSHKQKVVYSLAEPAIQLVPVLAHLGAWGAKTSARESRAIHPRGATGARWPGVLG